MATMMKRGRKGESERNRIAMAFRWLLNRHYQTEAKRLIFGFS